MELNVVAHRPSRAMNGLLLGALRRVLFSLSVFTHAHAAGDMDSLGGVSISPMAEQRQGVGDICLTDFSGRIPLETLAEPYSEQVLDGRMEAVIQPEISAWMSRRHWQGAYSLWRTARRCERGLVDALGVCTLLTPPTERACSGPEDSYRFLVMHRYLLQSLRAQWPTLAAPSGSWNGLPGLADYPEPLRDRFSPWPQSLLRDAEALGVYRPTGHAQAHGYEALAENGDDELAEERARLLARWPKEQALAQWMLCGTEQTGLGVNALYRALISNAVPIDDQYYSARPHLMDLHVFWQVHSLMDQIWENYRRIVGKTPDEPKLQAELIRQCRSHQHWLQTAAVTNFAAAPSDGSRFVDGALNPADQGRLVRLLAEVDAVELGPNSETLLRVNARLTGIGPLWVASYAPLAEDAVRIGERYLFVGSVLPSDSLGATGDSRQRVQTPALLMLQSLQTPR